MNGTNQNQSLGKSELRYYFIRLTICNHGKTCAFYGYAPEVHNLPEVTCLILKLDRVYIKSGSKIPFSTVYFLPTEKTS